MATVAIFAIFNHVGDAQLNLGQMISGGLGSPAVTNMFGDGVNKRGPGPPGTLDIIRARGFIGEFYLTKSRDGRAPISIYHIINPLADQRTLNRYPVLVTHGVVEDASSMVAQSGLQQPRRPVPGQVFVDPQRDTSLALTLADNNFDVWLADARGTNLNNHPAAGDLDPVGTRQFWNFTLDDQIANDLPAMIDFVLAQTHSNKLHYVGYSQSTYFMFALLSRSTYYQSRLVSFVALAPVAYLGHVGGSTLGFFSIVDFIPEHFHGNLLPFFLDETVSASMGRACNSPLLAKSICGLVSSGIAGLSQAEPTGRHHLASTKGVSIKSVRQFLQNIRGGRFRMYDYGPLVNLRHYGQPTPPDYQLENIKMPGIVLFRGTNDLVSNVPDQNLLLSHLGTKPFRDFNLLNYNHFDFTDGANVIRDVNAPAVMAMFELAQAHAIQDGAPSVLTDPQKASLPRPYKPMLVVQPPDGGSHETAELNSSPVNNLMQIPLARQQFGSMERKEPPLSQLPFVGGIQLAMQPLMGLAG